MNMTMTDTDEVKQLKSQEQCQVQNPDESLFWKESGKAVMDPRLYVDVFLGF